MERATQGEVKHALGPDPVDGYVTETVPGIMDALADHGLRVVRVGADACADREDDPAVGHEPLTVGPV